MCGERTRRYRRARREPVSGSRGVALWRGGGRGGGGEAPVGGQDEGVREARAPLRGGCLFGLEHPSSAQLRPASAAPPGPRPRHSGCDRRARARHAVFELLVVCDGDDGEGLWCVLGIPRLLRSHSPIWLRLSG